MRARKVELRDAVAKFNEKPKKGIELLLSKGFIDVSVSKSGADASTSSAAGA